MSRIDALGNKPKWPNQVRRKFNEKGETHSGWTIALTQETKYSFAHESSGV